MFNGMIRSKPNFYGSVVRDDDRGVASGSQYQQLNAEVLPQQLPQAVVVAAAAASNATAAPPTVVFNECPSNYCVGANSSHFRECKPGSNRDPAVPLCGGCLAGFSATFDSTNCVPNEKVVYCNIVQSNTCGGSSITKFNAMRNVLSCS